MFLITHAGFILESRKALPEEDIKDIYSTLISLSGVSAVARKQDPLTFVVAFRRGSAPPCPPIGLLKKAHGDIFVVTWIEDNSSLNHLDDTAHELRRVLEPPRWKDGMPAREWLANERTRAPLRKLLEEAEKATDRFGAVMD